MRQLAHLGIQEICASESQLILLVIENRDVYSSLNLLLMINNAKCYS